MIDEPPEDERPWIDDLEIDGTGVATVIDIRDRMPVGGVGVSFQRGDHVEIGRALVRELSHQGETVFTEGAWWNYSEERGVFRELAGHKVDVIIQQYAGAPVGTSKVLKLKASDVSGASKMAAAQATVEEFFSEARKGISFKNCFAVVGEHTVSPWALEPSNRARHCYPFNYTPGAVPVEFLAFLRSSFRDDDDAEEKVALIREFCSMALIGEATRFQLALVLFGEGSNGKGVLFKLMEAMMPPNSTVSIPPQSLGQEYRRAQLAGKRLNLVPEMPDADIMESEAFKSAVAGDQMEGRHIMKAPFYYYPIAAFAISANTLPATRDQSHGFWRRIVIITFNRIFGTEDQDKYLYERLLEELPAIVSWCLDIAPDVIKRGYTIPSSSAAAKDKWQRAANHVIEFLEEKTLPMVTPNDIGTRASELYHVYKNWATEHGYKSLASNKFGERMKKQQLQSMKREDGNYYPVRVRPEYFRRDY